MQSLMVFSSHTPMVDRAKEDGVPINVHFQQLVPVARIATSSRLLMRSSLPLHSRSSYVTECGSVILNLCWLDWRGVRFEELVSVMAF